jgi:hypothetical protein
MILDLGHDRVETKFKLSKVQSAIILEGIRKMRDGILVAWRSG